MCIGERSFSQARSLFICNLGLLSGRVSIVTAGKLSNVSVIVRLHLIEEYLGLVGLAIRYKIVIEQIQDVLANARQLLLNLALVSYYFLHIILVALGVLLLLD